MAVDSYKIMKRRLVNYYFLDNSDDEYEEVELEIEVTDSEDEARVKIKKSLKK